MQTKVICPLCGLADQVEKVSTIYIIGIGLNRKQAAQGERPDLPPPTSSFIKNLPDSEARQLSRRLKPPSSGKDNSFKPVHPDLVVISFSLILPIFLYGIWTSQRGQILPVLAVLLVCYGLYIWRRRVLVARFERQQASRAAAGERIKRGIARWMRLYYCAREDGVFEPGGDKLVPADQMPGYLLAE